MIDVFIMSGTALMPGSENSQLPRVIFVRLMPGFWSVTFGLN
jgi:hypothetical protein